MGLALRLLLLDQADRIYRLSFKRFERMREESKLWPLPQFAGERLRGSEVAVELIGRKPTRVIRMTFDVFTFDREGCLDSEALRRHQFARLASWQSEYFEPHPHTDRSPAANVVDAKQLFSDRGGRWVPSIALLHALDDAALGRVKVPRL
jgi:hypothetical protein